jgi:hypothetical protein
MKKIKKILERLYNWFLFPILMGFSLHSLHTLIDNYLS